MCIPIYTQFLVNWHNFLQLLQVELLQVRPVHKSELCVSHASGTEQKHMKQIREHIKKSLVNNNNNNNNNNHLICIAPYGRDFRGAGCMADRFSWV